MLRSGLGATLIEGSGGVVLSIEDGDVGTGLSRSMQEVGVDAEVSQGLLDKAAPRARNEAHGHALAAEFKQRTGDINPLATGVASARLNPVCVSREELVQGYCEIDCGING